MPFAILDAIGKPLCDVESGMIVLALREEEVRWTTKTEGLGSMFRNDMVAPRSVLPPDRTIAQFRGVAVMLPVPVPRSSSKPALALVPTRTLSPITGRGSGAQGAKFLARPLQ